MINSIIFSLDRPMQIHTLLESININAKDTFNINVLYKYSNDDFKRGYDILKERFKNINWVEETNFKEQTLKLMETDLSFSCFLVDDNIMFGKFKEEEITKALKENDDIFVFSPRQGLNTKKCYTLNSDNIILPDKEDETFIYWTWTNRYADAGYPISLDGHIFRTKEIKKLIKTINFSNPNTLEGNLQIFENYPKEKMFAYKKSILVGVPVNIVNNTHPNRKGEKFGISTKELNDKYLNGEIIDYNKLDFSNISAAHQEIKYEFKKY